MKFKAQNLSSLLLLLCFHIGFSQITITYNASVFATVTTPEAAILAVKACKASHAIMEHDIVVNISGEYVLESPLIFGLEDSGTNGHRIIYKAATPGSATFTGGRKIHEITTEEWQTLPNTTIHYINIGSIYSRQVYYSDNGTNWNKALRSRSDGNATNIKVSSYDFFNIDTAYFPRACPDDFANWPLPIFDSSDPNFLPTNLDTRIKDMEFVYNKEWNSSRIPFYTKVNSTVGINKINKINNTFLGNIRCNQTVSWIENAFELIDLPNEWYIDRSILGQNILYYKTNSTEPPNSHNIIIPITDKLIEIDNAKNISFEGINFQFTSWTGPSNRWTNDATNNLEYLNNCDMGNVGFANLCGDVYYDVKQYGAPPNVIWANQIPAAVNVTSSNWLFKPENLIFKNNIFEHIGSTALRIEHSSTNIISCNIFRDISGSGIAIGDQENHMVYDYTDNNTIVNNTIENIANEYFSSAGIFVVSGNNITIQHNEIKNFPSFGISVGWGIPDGTYNYGVNKISYNKIDCTNQMMEDVGAIYIIGRQGSASQYSSIFGNHIINYKTRYGAIYLDETSQYINVQNNVVELMSGSIVSGTHWVFSNRTRGSLNIQDNYFSVQYPVLPEHNLPISNTNINYISPPNSSPNSSEAEAIKTDSGPTCP